MTKLVPSRMRVPVAQLLKVPVLTGEGQELHASSSNQVPRTGCHPLLYPRDGYGASSVAVASNDFPSKPAKSETSGVDEVGPRWTIPEGNEHLLLQRQHLHLLETCPLINGDCARVTHCFCVDRLYKHFHYYVDERFRLHYTNSCKECAYAAVNVCPVVVLCRHCWTNPQ